MVKKYSREPPVHAKSCRARGDDLRVHYKNTFEVASCIRGRKLREAQVYLADVLDHKRVIPYRRHNEGVPRKAQCNQVKETTQGRWPEKSVKFVNQLLSNCEANAEVKGLDVDNLIVWHTQVNRAQKGRRRTYRAHGRINPFLSSNCHVEIICCERPEQVSSKGLTYSE